MSNNTLGKIFTVHSFGESHGPYVGCVIDGMPAGLAIDIDAIQAEVNARKTGQLLGSSDRKEDDQVELISGVFENKTIGSPIAILIKNKDAKSSDYDKLKDVFRPNHADFTNLTKYGLRDYRGGGRSSIRITAPLVAAGALALQAIQQLDKAEIITYVKAIGGIESDQAFAGQSQAEIYEQPQRMLNTIPGIVELIENTKAEGDTLGGIIQGLIFQPSIGLGEPVFNKFQAALAQAMLSINTVKGFEYGDGFAAAAQKGSEHNDPFVSTPDGVSTLSNHSGGLQGGITNGATISFKVAFKPISSIQKLQQTINEKGNNIALQIDGRHDVCAVPRAVPIVRAYTAIIYLDYLLQKRFNKI